MATVVSSYSNNYKNTLLLHHHHHSSSISFLQTNNLTPFLSSSSRRHRSLSTSAASSSLDDIIDISGGQVLNKGTSNSKVLLKGMSFTDLQKWVQSYGFRAGQAIMLWKALYADGVWAHSVDELQGLNKDLKIMLSKHAEFKALSLKDIITASDGTRKNGLEEAPDDCGDSRTGCTCTAFAGMGEPLHNVENVIKAADIMVHDQGLHFSPRKVTISTSGLVPQLKRFLHESNCALAVSLNATTDEVRNWIMPINRKYKLGLLLDTLKEELRSKRNYKVLFEYVMLEGVNDSFEDAKRLINLVQGIPCKINLISFNPHNGSNFKPTREEKMIEFRNILAEGGCTVFMRWSRGDDQMAACGQLGKLGTVAVPLLRVPEQFKTALKEPML
ncbi:hypothetical protein ACFE04_025349 [Oxalis oulophora]